MLCKQDEQARWFLMQDSRANKYNVNLSFNIPLDKLQSTWAIVRILQIEVVVACKHCSDPIDETIMWSQDHLSFNAQHPRPRLHRVPWNEKRDPSCVIVKKWNAEWKRGKCFCEMFNNPISFGKLWLNHQSYWFNWLSPRLGFNYRDARSYFCHKSLIWLLMSHIDISTNFVYSFVLKKLCRAAVLVYNGQLTSVSANVSKQS